MSFVSDFRPVHAEFANVNVPLWKFGVIMVSMLFTVSPIVAPVGDFRPKHLPEFLGLCVT